MCSCAQKKEIETIRPRSHFNCHKNIYILFRWIKYTYFLSYIWEKKLWSNHWRRMVSYGRCFLEISAIVTMNSVERERDYLVMCKCVRIEQQ